MSIHAVITLLDKPPQKFFHPRIKCNYGTFYRSWCQSMPSLLCSTNRTGTLQLALDSSSSSSTSFSSSSLFFFFFLICNPNLQKPQIPYLLPTSIYYRKFPLQIMCAAHGKQFSFKIVPLLPICKGLPIFCRSGCIFPKIKIRGHVPNT